jgi:hypothetical protein
VRRGAWLTLTEVSPALREALVLSEDRRFWAHGGVDWQALAASAWANAWNTRTRGASTLTMQLAGLLQRGSGAPRRRPQRGAEVTQMARAQQLERRWTKAQILEAYLNHVPLRGELVGVGAASQVLFGKFASGLDQTEAAVLAVMVRGPNANAATLERRACEVLRQQKLSCAPAGHHHHAGAGAAARCTAHGRQRGRRGHRTASGATHRATGGSTAPATPGTQAPVLALRSTLDARVQRTALAALRRQLAELRGRTRSRTAPCWCWTTRAAKSWPGWAPACELSAAAAVDAVTARRQPGSTLKPFVYGMALRAPRPSPPPALIEDAPLQIHRRRAVRAAELRTDASRLDQRAHRAGVSSTCRRCDPGAHAGCRRVASRALRRFGFDSLTESGDWYGYSAGAGLGRRLAAGAGQCLPHAGQRRPLERLARHARRRGSVAAKPLRAFAGAPRQALALAASWWATSSPTRAARAGTFGLDSPLVTPRLERGEDRHQQGHARQLVHRLLARYTVACVGRQCQRRADARGQRHQRCGAGVARGDAAAACAVSLRRAATACRPGGAQRRVVPAPAPNPMPDTAAGGCHASAIAAFGIQSPRDGSVFCSTRRSRGCAAMVFAGAPASGGSTAGLLGSGPSCTGCRGPGAPCAGAARCGQACSTATAWPSRCARRRPLRHRRPAARRAGRSRRRAAEQALDRHVDDHAAQAVQQRADQAAPKPPR